MWVANNVADSLPLFLVVNLCLLVLGTQAGCVLDAYKLVQMDIDGSPLGSRSVRLSQYANMHMEGVKLYRSVVVIPFSQATDQIVKDLVSEKNGISGMLFVLPSNFDNGALDDEDRANFMAIEKYLAEVSIPFPVYFTVETEDLQRMVKEIERDIKKGKPGSSAKGGYMMVVKGTEAKPVKGSQIINFEGWLPGSEGARPGASKDPTVVITAHYDTFTAAPGLAFSSGSNGSGTLALLSLVRMFGRLYSSDEGLRPRHNILFLLTGGGKLDSAGLKFWLKTANSRLLDSIELVISLDSLSGWGTEKSGDLYLHHSKPRAKDETAAAWYDRFAGAATQEGVTLHQAQKKINLGLPYVPWEHEHVAQQKMLAVTLSGRSKGVPPSESTSVLDRMNSVNLTAVARASRIVAEAVGMRLFPDKDGDVHVFKEGSTFDASLPFLQRWLETLDSNPRMAPFFSAKSPVGVAILRLLNDHTKGTVDAFHMEERYKFYDGQKYVLTVFKTAGAMFDMVFLAAWSFYLVFLYVVLKVVTQGWDELFAGFRPRPTKWKNGQKGYGKGGKR
ncbi:hypothetical protein BSKO_07249 [Bryopsis sp. KO-2023]|nr:hypothetical protein BSKO_07249 [Bryopsis sp. KO-2023]